MGTNIVEMERAEGVLRPTIPHTPLTLGRRVYRLTECQDRPNLYPREPLLTEAERTEAESLLPAYRAYLMAGKRDDISARILTLRAHYFMPDMPKGLADAVADDWTDDLGSYPLWAVKAACDRYRRFQATRAPRPADIIAFAEEEIEHKRREMQDIERALRPAPSVEADKDKPATPQQIGAILEKAGLREAIDEIAVRKKRRLRSGG